MNTAFTGSVLAMAVALLAAGCGGGDRPAPPSRPAPPPPDPGATGVLHVSSIPGGVLLENTDSVTVYVAVYDARVLPFIEWAPCTDPATCDGIPPGGRRTETLGDDVSDTVMIFWWRLVPAGEGRLTPDTVRAIPLATP